MADVAKGVARLDRVNPPHQRVVGDLNQAFGLAGQFARHIHAACVTEPAVHDHGHVDVQDVAILQRLVTGDAVTHYVVHADAACVLIALVTDRRRFGACGIDHIRDDPVDLGRGLARKDMFGHRIKDTRRQCAGGIHACGIGRIVDAYAVLGQTAPVFLFQQKSPLALVVSTIIMQVQQNCQCCLHVQR